MSNEKLGQEAAFASSYDEFMGHDSMGNRLIERINEIGMSKRFYAACTAMQGILADGHSNSEKSIELIIQESYLCADELLKQENL